ncbi:MAG TPA: GtrA family protein [Nocardioides sp.]|jgi:putative flippase GtrA|nr:GtrA family protein [Nocardioides sp.]
MPGPPDSSLAAATADRRVLVPKLLRYFTGSVVATVCSEVSFVVLYGLLDVGTTWSSIVSWLAGAVPNFWLNRNWAWQRSGRPSLRHEVLPYVVIILTTLLLATVATHAADTWLHEQGVAPSVRVVLVAGVFLGVYVVVFAVRFVLLERLFKRLEHRESASASSKGSR